MTSLQLVAICRASKNSLNIKSPLFAAWNSTRRNKSVVLTLTSCASCRVSLSWGSVLMFAIHGWLSTCCSVTRACGSMCNIFCTRSYNIKFVTLLKIHTILSYFWLISDWSYTILPYYHIYIYLSSWWHGIPVPALQGELSFSYTRQYFIGCVVWPVGKRRVSGITKQKVLQGIKMSAHPAAIWIKLSKQWNVLAEIEVHLRTEHTQRERKRYRENKSSQWHQWKGLTAVWTLCTFLWNP